MALSDNSMFLLKNTKTDFNGVIAGDGKNLLEIEIDDAPTENSDNLVTSGGVFNALGTQLPIVQVQISVDSKDTDLIGAAIDAKLANAGDCNFMGYVASGGAGVLFGWHYVSGGKHYWTACVCFFGLKPRTYQGQNGTYAKYD